MVEVATIGREGMVGVTAVLDGNPVSSVSMVQGESDTCYRMKADAYRREMERRGVFYELLTHYAQALEKRFDEAPDTASPVREFGAAYDRAVKVEGAAQPTPEAVAKAAYESWVQKFP